MFNWMSHSISANNSKIRVKFILPSNFGNTELWPVNHILTFENSDLKASKKINANGEILKKIENASLGVNACKTCRPYWYRLLTRFQWNITTSLISSWGMFSPFLPLIISLLLLLISSIVSEIESSSYYPVFILNVILF